MIKFEQITDVDHPRFSQVFQLYEETFPLYERMPTFWIQENFKNKLTEIWIGFYDGEFALMAIIDKLADRQVDQVARSANSASSESLSSVRSDWILLSYLATVPHLRNVKIGSQFLTFLIQYAQQRSQPILLEVEHPAFGENQALKQRRVEFYRRFGAMCLSANTWGDLVYWLPSFTGESPTEMLLMLIDPLTRSSLTKSDVKRYIQTIYQQIYRQPAHAPIFNWLADLPDPIYLRS